MLVAPRLDKWRDSDSACDTDSDKLQPSEYCTKSRPRPTSTSRGQAPSAYTSPPPRLGTLLCQTSINRRLPILTKSHHCAEFLQPQLHNGSVAVVDSTAPSQPPHQEPTPRPDLQPIPPPALLDRLKVHPLYPLRARTSARAAASAPTSSSLDLVDLDRAVRHGGCAPC